jgi:hypothetical protein
LVAQGGLADAWFADEHDQPSVTRCSGLEGSLELAQLTLAAHK